MDGIESVAKSMGKQVALGVGLHSDYGAAQRMYVKRGYIPDGSGVWHGNKNLAPYENCVNDDDLNMFFIKDFAELKNFVSPQNSTVACCHYGIVNYFCNN